MPSCGASGPGLSRTKMPRPCCLVGELHQSVESVRGEGGDSAGPAVRDEAASSHPEVTYYTNSICTWHITQTQICFPMERCHGYMNRSVSSGTIDAGSLFIRSQPYFLVQKAPAVSEPQLFHRQCGAGTQHLGFGG